MLIVISPAKTLDLDAPGKAQKHTQPAFIEDSSELMSSLSKLSASGLSKLMGISDDLAQLNFERNQSWQTPFSKKNAKQAVLAFKGDVYTGLEADNFSSDDMAFAQKHLRILSGLYGMLRPLDLMQAYRLEMGVKFENPRGKNLYEFWGTKLTDELNSVLKKNKSEHLVNLSSNEYFKSLQKKDINASVVTPSFKEWKNGEYKMLSFFAKKARGTMSRFIITNRITDAADLEKFDLDGYRLSKRLSKEHAPVFTRKQ